MNETFSPERSTAIRQGLVGVIDTDLHRGATRLRRWMAGTLLVLLGGGAGAAVSAAAFASSETALIGAPSGVPSADLGGAVPAPAGVLPGAPIISMLGTPFSRSSKGDEQIPLPGRPPGATHLRVAISCLTPGHTTWGTSPDGNNPAISCSSEDLERYGNAFYDFPIDESIATFYLRAPTGVAVSVSMQYLRYVPTQLGVNQHGQTYGVQAQNGTNPDLTAVTGLAPDGTAVDGYVLTTSLNDFGPDWTGQPSDPSEALAWQEERDVRYPDGWDLPVFESDGTTQIGVFHVSN